MSASAVKPRGRGTILLLAAVAALGSLATQLLVPALPVLARDLRISPGDAQLAISIYRIGLGSGQLVAGPMADRNGRKPVLLTGLVLYCVGSLAAALAASLPLLLAARLVQSLGASAGVVTARVLVGDLFPPEEAAKRQASLMAVILISPAVAPAIGGAISEVAGWRALFFVLMAAGAGGLLLSLTALPTVRRAAEKARISVRAALARLLRNPRFLAPTVTIASSSSGLYMFLGTAPFLLAHDHGLSPRDVGLATMLVATSSICGTFAVSRIDRRGHALITGAWLLFGGAAALGIASLIDGRSLVGFMVPMMVLGFGAGICGPAGIARVIRSEEGLEGTSTSICGAMQMLASACSAALFSRLASATEGGLAAGLLIATSSAVLAAFWDRKRDVRACIKSVAH